MPGQRGSIFQRQWLRPTQLQTVAVRRWDDAEFLLHSRKNKHANGAMYLAGFVVECLLKAELLREHPWLQSARDPGLLDHGQRRLWSQYYRSHDLDEILATLPGLRERLSRVPQSRVLNALRRICAEWTIFARYSTRTAEMTEARLFLSRVQEVKAWL